MDVKKELEKGLTKSIEQSSAKEIYTSLCEMVNRYAADNEQKHQGKKL